MESTTIENNSPPKPDQVSNAVILLYASLAVGAAKAMLDFARVASGAIGFAICVMVITFVILIFFIVKISAGKNWARITFLILFLLGLPFFIPLVLQEFAANVFVGILSVVQTLLQLVAMVFLFLGSSNAWFKFQKAK